MSSNIQLFIYFLFLLFIYNLNGEFTPNTADFNSYGVKIAMNEFVFIEVHNDYDPPVFLIQFAPYNYVSSFSQCFISFPNALNHYIYTVTIAKNQTQFFFAGELINDRNGTFVGVGIYNNLSTTCNTKYSFSLQYFYNYEHQDYYIIDVESKGRFAYGFSNTFMFIFDSHNTSVLNLWNANETWPHNTFIPHAIDLADTYGVIAGFIHNPTNTTAAVYLPMIYLINFNSSNNRPIIVDQYEPNGTIGTWQYLLINSDADTYAAKYDMSVSINEYGNILVGMQFINRVFLFSVNRININKLNFLSRNTNGRSIGNGKSVAWLDNGIAAIIVNTYSLTYEWSSSEIYLFDIKNDGYNSNSTPLSIFPNRHQTVPLSLSLVFINIVSSPSSLALLDNLGNVLIVNPTPSGYFPTVKDTGSMPIFTVPHICLPGTYKNRSGIHDCILCPTGTKNPGNSSLQCISCLSGSFCPLGSVNDVSHSALETIMQATAYPTSPESTIFDEILIQNMFNIGSGHCLLVSPLFWTLIVAGVAIIIIIIMVVLKNCVNHPRSQRIRNILKWFFKHTDLIGEGELWFGGLASFAVIVLVSFAYSFSNNFLKQYPIETSSDSHFACDLSLRNAKFQTNIQSLSIPVKEGVQKMFDLLDNQTFYLNIEFVNTLIDCDVISLQALFGTKWSPIRWINCTNQNSILSLSIQLPYHHISVQVLLADTQTIGGLRIGLSAAGEDIEPYDLEDLNFYQSFFKQGETLGQNLPITLDITKVINETNAMIGEESNFDGIFIPTFVVDINSLFLTQDQYVRSTSTLTTLTIVISETPYYVKNLQQPIAKRSEIIFHNILFTIVCLEIFGLLFLLYKLFFRPLLNLCLPQYTTKNNKKKLHHEPEITDMSCAF
ncbi:unnamed protein product [Adineta steineri]|uniref:Uncharacterized protein n=1 Tax=Adineta steineri TaxID=433720 RepID=A0A814G8Y7_9BILA|nr:unnamed protein product [Adineta steineri]CAF0990937.1 unnamed protein product [Adineta steineri]